MLALIPARGGSKGVPGKALRTVGGVPLILRTLRTAKEAGCFDRVVVSTDSEEIGAFCRMRGFEVIERPASLGEDHVPLIDVARHAVEALGWEQEVAMLQPTCPLLRPETVRRVVEQAQKGEHAWVITAAADPHIHWMNGTLMTPRLQRQELDEVARESGAVQYMRPEYLTGFGSSGTVRIDTREALDIDTPDDLVLAERLVRTARITFAVATGPRIGSGHYWRSKALAEALGHHNIWWSWRGRPIQWADVPYPSPAGRGYEDFDLVVFDKLHVNERELASARAAGTRTVVLEDEEATGHADLIVNDMLDPADLRYAILRPEFLCLPERQHVEEGKRVLVTFGGTDPARLADRLSSLLDVMVFGDGTVQGPLVLDVIRPGASVHMAARMRAADLIVTGQGRTVLEAAACGTPCISIAANEREARHLKLPGVTYLGLHASVTDDTIRQTVRCLLADRELREENAKAAGRVVDGRGLDRLVHAVEGLLL